MPRLQNARCPACGASYGPGDRYCRVDGTALVRLPAPAGDDPTLPSHSPGEARPTRPLKPARPGADPLIGKVIDGRYRVKAQIGEGGVGAVYEAEHLQIRRKVALKVLHPQYALSADLRARFEREAHAASKLTHPGCVQVIDFGTSEGRSYLVMEFVTGTLLSERLAAPMAPSEAVQIVTEILAALSYAHAQGIVHRDIKPGNVMLCDRTLTGSRVKILDFGLAKNLNANEQTASLTQLGMVFGTPGYMPPEQAIGKPVDARGDLYSVGVVLFEMLCGEKPFARRDQAPTLGPMLAPAPRARSIRSELSPDIEAAVARALEKDPGQRFQTAAEFVEALTATPEGSPLPERDARLAQADTLTPARSGRPARRWLVAGLAAAVLLVSVVAIVLLRSSGPQVAAVRTSPPPRRVAPVARAPRVEGPRPVQPRPEQPRPVQPRPVQPRPVQPRPVQPRPVQPRPVQPRPVQPRPVQPRPVQPRPVQPRPVQPRPGQGGAVASKAELPSPALRRAEAALASRRYDSAILHARDAVKVQRSSARPYRVLGDAYYAKMWFTDALEEYSKAIRRSNELRNDPEIIRRAVRCLGKPGVSWHASSFLVNVIGPPAVAALRDAAQHHEDANVRRRAAAALQRLRP